MIHAVNSIKRTHKHLLVISVEIAKITKNSVISLFNMVRFSFTTSKRVAHSRRFKKCSTMTVLLNHTKHTGEFIICPMQWLHDSGIYEIKPQKHVETFVEKVQLFNLAQCRPYPRQNTGIGI